MATNTLGTLAAAIAIVACLASFASGEQVARRSDDECRQMYVSSMTDGLELSSEVVAFRNYAREQLPGVQQPWNKDKPIDKQSLAFVQKQYPVRKCSDYMDEFKSRDRTYRKIYPDCYQAIEGLHHAEQMMQNNPKYNEAIQASVVCARFLPNVIKSMLNQ